jgi:hypothetical protein
MGLHRTAQGLGRMLVPARKGDTLRLTSIGSVSIELNRGAWINGFSKRGFFGCEDNAKAQFKNGCRRGALIPCPRCGVAVCCAGRR